MGGVGRDVHPTTSAEPENLAVKLQGRHTGKHVEELLGGAMEVPLFTFTRRHPFLDYAQRIRFEQMPAIRLDAPLVVFRIRGIYDRHER